MLKLSGVGSIMLGVFCRMVVATLAIAQVTAWRTDKTDGTAWIDVSGPFDVVSSNPYGKLPGEYAGWTRSGEVMKARVVISYAAYKSGKPDPTLASGAEIARLKSDSSIKVVRLDAGNSPGSAEIRGEILSSTGESHQLIERFVTDKDFQMWRLVLDYPTKDDNANAAAKRMLETFEVVPEKGVRPAGSSAMAAISKYKQVELFEPMVRFDLPNAMVAAAKLEKLSPPTGAYLECFGYQAVYGRFDVALRYYRIDTTYRQREIDENMKAAVANMKTSRTHKVTAGAIVAGKVGRFETRRCDFTLEYDSGTMKKVALVLVQDRSRVWTFNVTASWSSVVQDDVDPHDWKDVERFVASIEPLDDVHRPGGRIRVQPDGRYERSGG